MRGYIQKMDLEIPGTITFHLEENEDGSIDLVGNNFDCEEEVILRITNEGKVTYNDGCGNLNGLSSNKDGTIELDNEYEW